LIAANRHHSLAALQGRSKRRVGIRELCGTPPWIEFPGEQSTRFTFASYEEARELLDRLGEFRWTTFDMA
jgi:hypothetical protein